MAKDTMAAVINSIESIARGEAKGEFLEGRYRLITEDGEIQKKEKSIYIAIVTDDMIGAHIRAVMERHMGGVKKGEI